MFNRVHVRWTLLDSVDSIRLRVHELTNQMYLVLLYSKRTLLCSFQSSGHAFLSKSCT